MTACVLWCCCGVGAQQTVPAREPDTVDCSGRRHTRDLAERALPRTQAPRTASICRLRRLMLLRTHPAEFGAAAGALHCHDVANWLPRGLLRAVATCGTFVGRGSLRT